MNQSYYVVISSISVSSVSGSGPSYNVTYLSDPSAAKIGDKVIVEKRDAGAGAGSTILSTYTYIVTATNYLSYQLTLKYEYDTAGLGDDSPADLYSGGGSSGSPQIAPHKVVRLTAPFVMFSELL